MSGQYPARFGLTAHIPGHWKPFEKLAEPPCALSLPTNLVSIARVLRNAGYATASFGKWHLDWRGQGTPEEHGFQTAFEFIGHNIPGARQDPPSKTPKRAMEYLTDRAVEFLDHNRDKPMFLYLCPSAVHIPLNTTAELEKKYQSKPKTKDYSCNPLYAGLLEEMDQGVGRVMAALERLGLAENTLVIFTSDNGGLEREVGGWPGTSNRPLRNEKGSLYEGGIRVPLIVRWPGMTKTAAVTETVAISVDFYPTLLEAAKTKPGKSQLLDGASLVAALRSPNTPRKREAIYWHYPHYYHSRPSGALRWGDWKAIEFFDTGEVELYNLEQDLSESKNLAAEMPDRTESMREKLQRWRQQVSAQMPQPNPAYDPKRVDEWWNRGTVARTEAPGAYRVNGAK